jgi:prepilin-type processing-associated H-X9-DG protein
MKFTEEGSAYDTVSDGQPDVHTTAQLDAARQLITNPLTLIGCPSRRAGSNQVFPKPVDGSFYAHNASQASGRASGAPLAGRSDYAINCGDQVRNEINPSDGGSGPPSLPAAATYNWCVRGSTGATRSANCSPPITGISFQRSAVAVRHVTDGASKTYLIGEKFLNPLRYETGDDSGDNETWCTGYNNDNFRSSYMPPAQDTVVDVFAPIYPGDTAQHSGREIFGSAHVAGLNMSFCDGHVDVIDYAIDPYVHRANGNRKDGS